MEPDCLVDSSQRLFTLANFGKETCSITPIDGSFTRIIGHDCEQDRDLRCETRCRIGHFPQYHRNEQFCSARISLQHGMELAFKWMCSLARWISRFQVEEDAP